MITSNDGLEPTPGQLAFPGVGEDVAGDAEQVAESTTATPEPEIREVTDVDGSVDVFVKAYVGADSGVPDSGQPPTFFDMPPRETDPRETDPT